MAEIRLDGPHGPLDERVSARQLDRLAAQAPDPRAFKRYLAVEQAVAGSPIYVDNSVRVLRNGAQTFPAIFAAIAGAKHYVYLEYYIFEDVRSGGRSLGDLLVEKSREGVAISIIYDAFGSLDTPGRFHARLRAAHIRITAFNPLDPLAGRRHYSPNSRDHRKILVVDGAVAIIGGVNLSSDYESAPHVERVAGPAPPHELWHDIDVEIRGPAVARVAGLFRAQWRAATGRALAQSEPASASPQVGTQLVRRRAGTQLVRIIGSSPRLAPRYYATVISAMRGAHGSILVTAAYFVPTHQEMAALRSAARRGVDVELLLPSHSDSPPALAIQRSHYASLLRAGVRLYERQGGIVHSKTLVVDGIWSLVGSSNFDERSVLFNDEIDAVILGRSTARQLRAAFEAGVRRAKRITREDVRRRGFLERLRGWFWRLWEPLF